MKQWKRSWRKHWSTYLDSGHWKALRKQAFERDGHKCIKCGSGFNLRGHHKKYRKNLRDCTVDDIETLCNDCYQQHHREQRFERKIRKKIVNTAPPRIELDKDLDLALRKDLT